MKIAFIFLFALCCFSSYAQEVSHVENDEALRFQSLFSTDTRPGAACFRIPSMVTATNGDLIAAIDERVPSCGDLKWNKNINIVMRRSTDNGHNWSAIETIVDYPDGQSASDPSMIVDKLTGNLFLFFNFMDLDKEKDIYYLKYILSEDHGKTWSTPTDISSQITRPEWDKDFKFITSGRGIQTSKGQLLHTMVNLQRGLFIFGSDDHGKSWYFIDTPIAPADESKLVELSDGSWMVNSRVNKAGLRYVHISSDEGKTWTSKPDSSLIDPGCNASIIRSSVLVNGLEQNLLLFSNASSSDGRRNLTLKFSLDEGKTWSAGKTIYSGSSAYSTMTILENGDIGLFFEKDDYQKNVFVRLPLDWLDL